MKKKVKEKPLSFYKKKLDAIFSKYIRARDKHTCYTCGLKMESNRSQCGHFVPRQYLSVRFSEINCHCQCYACNMLYNGQPSAYAEHLRREYGDHIIMFLEDKRKEITKLTPQWYLEQIEIYQNKLEDL